jgi:hypothetical protein
MNRKAVLAVTWKTKEKSSSLISWPHFKKKKSGACYQLPGPTPFTSQTPKPLGLKILLNTELASVFVPFFLNDTPDPIPALKTKTNLGPRWYLDLY